MRLYQRLALVLILLTLRSNSIRADPSSTEDIETSVNLGEEALNSCTRLNGKSKAHVSIKPGATLSDLVTWAMSFSCKNFVYTSVLASRSAKIDIVAPSELSPRQSWRLFQVALRSLGLTVIEDGALLQIVELPQAAKAALPMRQTSSGGQSMERLIVQPDFISIEEAQRALSALTSAQGEIVALPSAGALLVTDYGVHTERMAELLRRVDRAGSNEALFAIHVQYADVDQAAKLLGELLAGKPGVLEGSVPSARNSKTAPTPTAPSLIVADARTRTLLLRASEATYTRALQIIQELDRKLESDDSSRIHVYPLQHADATMLAATLASLAQRGAPAQPPVVQAGRERGTSQAGGGDGAVISGKVEISADIETNSLLILASLRDYRAMRELLASLDQQRPQVFLEVTILEIDLDHNLDFGGSFHLGSADTGKLLFGGSQQEGSRTASTSSFQKNAQQKGLIAGALGALLPTEQFLGVSIPSFAVLFQAVAEDRRIDIISAPQIMTTNNTQATLSVGQNVAYKAGSSIVGDHLVDSIKRENIEMSLEVTPHVNLDGMVRLQVELNIKELLPNQPGVEPSWTTRKIVNTVVVEDQESIAIGGLASEQESTVKSKVPLLGDIPFLGTLFRSTAKKKSKRNLLVLLTPYVLNSSAEARRLTQRKLHERDAFLRSVKTLRERKFDPDIDYRKKRGLLADINAAVLASEREAAAIKELEERWRAPINGALGEDE